MSIDGFANAVDLMQKALAGLVEAGAVRRVGDAQPTTTKAPATAAAPQAPNASPNFN
jgi:hypothetical protein